MLADLLGGPTLFALGVMGLMGVFVWMASRRGRRCRRIDPPHARLAGPHIRAGRLAPSPPTAEQFEQSLGELEVRLFDFDREVTARVETTLSTLDRLIEEADREIGRLEDLLARTERTLPGRGHRPVLTAEDRRLVRHLLTAGYSTEEVARLVGCTAAEVLAADSDADTDEDSDSGPTRRAA
jgi:hypothetical protein